MVGLESICEVVALEKLCHGEFAGEPDDVGKAERTEPVALPPDLSAVTVDDLEELREVGLGVLYDLLVGQHWPRGGPARRVADLRCPIAHDYHDGVAEVLELSKLSQADRVSQVNVRGAGIEPHLEPKGASFFQTLDKFILGNYAGHAPPQDSVPLFIGECHVDSSMGVAF